MTTTIAIEMNDVGLLAAGDVGLIGSPSPGYALLNGKDLWVGSEAQASSRLKPRWVDNRFWDRLDTAAMPRPFPRNLSRADVAHSHLEEVWREIQMESEINADTASVMLAVPGVFSVEQLGLVLGIARATGIPVSGMVDAAVAAVAQVPTGPRVLHLDVLLHKWIWTELRHDGELARQQVEVIDDGGLVKIWDAWARRIAEMLVRQTRFDPFHHGRAEQALYDHLPEWLDTLAREGSVLVTLGSEGKNRTVELNKASVGGVTGDLIAPVVQLARILVGSGGPTVLALSARAVAVPGLVDELARLMETSIVELDSGAAARGTLDFRQQIESPGSDLPFVVRLPAELQQPVTAAASRATAEPPAAGAPRPVPTHVLFENRAIPIGRQPLWLGSAIDPDERGVNVGGPIPGLSRMHCRLFERNGQVWIEDQSSYGTFLNGTRVVDKIDTTVGDRLRLGSPGVELLLIEVPGDDV